MKILILQNIVSSNNVYMINTLIRKLKLEKHDLAAYFCGETERNRHWKLHETPNFNIQVLNSKKVELAGKDLFTYFINLNIFQVLNHENPDWIIVGGFDQSAYQAAILWGRWQGKRVTLWSGSTAYEKSWRRTIARPLVKLLVACSTDFLAYGTRAKDYLISLGAKPHAIEILPNDVNQAYFKTQAGRHRPQRKSLKKIYGIPALKNFLYVGQLIERKGILTLLEAYQQFVRTHSDWGLIIVGVGYMKDTIEQFAKDNHLWQIRLFGNIEQYDLPAYYVCADCLILPSHEEVWGLVVKEAIACGLPTIVSDRCGCGPDLKHRGDVHIFKAGNSLELVRYMERIA